MTLRGSRLLSGEAILESIGLTPTDSNFIVGDGTNWVPEAGTTARISLGVPEEHHIPLLTLSEEVTF